MSGFVFSIRKEMFANKIKDNLKQKKIFEEVYACHFKKVQFYAYNYLKDSEKAENIAQDVFLALWEQMDIVQEDGEILPYLFVLTKYRCLNWLRREKHHTKYTQEKISSADISITALKDESSTQLYSKEVTQLINKSLLQMPDKVRETFIFSKFRDLKNREIAQKQKISEKTVEYRISYAYKILRKNLKDYALLLILVLLLWLRE